MSTSKFTTAIRVALLAFSAYILSDDLFFFFAHYYVLPLEGFPLGLQGLIYVLVTINLWGVGWIIVCLVKQELFSYRRIMFSVIGSLLVVMSLYFLVLIVNLYPEFSDHILTFLPLNIKTLVLLSALFFLRPYGVINRKVQ